MDDAEFKRIFEALTPRQRQVLKPFLLGKSDDAIARLLHLETSTVRRHLANICRHFHLKNTTGEHFSYRDQLIELFTKHQPDWVDLQALGQVVPLGDFPGTPLAIDSRFYIPRPPIETLCGSALSQRGALIRIRAPRYMGKTSLLNRALNHGSNLGYQTVRLNLGQVEPTTLTKLDLFLSWICLNISQKLGISVTLNDYWDPQLGSLISCTAYLQTVLQNLDTNLILGIDEVDWLLGSPDTARSFFVLLRSWHEEANNLEVWQKLRLIVVHSTEVYIPLNLHQSPFNVGLPLQLPPLTFEQGMELAQLYGLSVKKSIVTELPSLYALIGGHPYLMQLAFYHLRHGDISLSQLLKTASTQSGIYSSHLRRLWQTVNSRPELMQALQQISQTEATLEPTTAYQLESMGLIQLQGNQSRMSCELYRRYFQSLL